MNEPTLRIRFIGECEQCKSIKAVDIPAHKETRKSGCGHAVTKVVQHNFPAHVVPACPSCGGRIHWQKLHGTHSKKHRCDDRCLAAKGPTCVCECGGANHGSAWL